VRFLTIAALALSLAACGSSSGSSSAPTIADTGTASATTTTSSGRTLHVTIKNLAFVPKAIHAKVGDTIRFTNQDTPPHNVTWVSGVGGSQFPPSPTLDTGAEFTLKLTQPGTIQYFCSIHPFMKASIVVTG
jgi:plastocyanin